MIQVADNFSYKGKKPNFDRDQFATLAAMKAFSDNYLDEGHIAYCVETGMRYEWKSTNAVDDNTGKWRAIGDRPLAQTTGQSTTEAMSQKAVTDALALKANSSDMTTALAAKVNNSDFTTYQGQVTAALALKVNTSDFTTYQGQVTDALALKANSSDMTTALTGKANTSGEYPNLTVGHAATADDLTGSSIRAVTSASYIIRTTAGDLDIMSSETVLLLDVLGGTDAALNGYTITGFRWNKFNELNPANKIAGIISGTTIASGSNQIAYIHCPTCEFGRIYESMANNGYLITDSQGQPVIPLSFGWSAEVPTVGTVLSAVEVHTEDNYYFYLPQEGYFCIEFPSTAALANICVHLAWSKDYDRFEAFSAGSTINLSPAVTQIRANGKMYGLTKNGEIIADEIILDSVTSANNKWYRRCEYQALSGLTWTLQVIPATEETDPQYIFTAPLTTMQSDGAFNTDLTGLTVEGNTLEYISNSITTLEDFTQFIADYGIVYELATKVSGAHSISTANMYGDDMSTEEVLGATNKLGIITTSYVRSLKDYLRGLPSELSVMNDRITANDYLQPLYGVGQWLTNASIASTSDYDNVTSMQTLGSIDWLTDWRPYLIDMTAVEGETHKRPVAELNKVNWLRDIYDNFQPVVGITQAMYDECMTNALYSDDQGETEYCAAGAFNPETYYASCQVVIDEDTQVRSLYMPKLYKAVDNEGTTEYVEVTHYLMPWETVETKYSIFVGRPESAVYLMDNVIGASGNEWNGVFASPQCFWDGVSIESYKLARTGISPSPVTAISDNSLTKLRCFFFNYTSGLADCKGNVGSAANSQLFYNNGTYPYKTLSMVNNCTLACNNNYDNTKTYPVAEGGYHARNTFLRCVEIAAGTKYLCSSTRFSSGISSNDACNNETYWRANGGVRWKKQEAANWTYCKWSDNTGIYKNATGGRDNAVATLCNYVPKSKTLEAQIAVSYAVELGIPAGINFEFNGTIWRYENVSLSKIKTVAQGQMNCRVYKIVSGSFQAYNSDGTEQTFDVECMLRTGLMLGCDMSGDINVAWGGGCELIADVKIASGTARTGNFSYCYLQPDQMKWVKDSNVEIAGTSRFTCEDKYIFLGAYKVDYDNYCRRRLPFHPITIRRGSSSLAYGESGYNYATNYYGSTANKRVRRRVSFGFHANNSNLSPRYFSCSYSASSTGYGCEGSAQVLLATQ